MLRILTHSADATGAACRFCGAGLLRPVTPATWPPYTWVGKIESTHGGDSVYPAGKNDTNPPCKVTAPATLFLDEIERYPETPTDHDHGHEVL